jgi:hypothetical protein
MIVNKKRAFEGSLDDLEPKKMRAESSYPKTLPAEIWESIATSLDTVSLYQLSQTSVWHQEIMTPILWRRSNTKSVLDSLWEKVDKVAEQVKTGPWKFEEIERWFKLSLTAQERITLLHAKRYDDSVHPFNQERDVLLLLHRDSFPKEHFYHYCCVPKMRRLTTLLLSSGITPDFDHLKLVTSCHISKVRLDGGSRDELSIEKVRRLLCALPNLVTLHLDLTGFDETHRAQNHHDEIADLMKGLRGPLSSDRALLRVDIYAANNEEKRFHLFSVTKNDEGNLTLTIFDARAGHQRDWLFFRKTISPLDGFARYANLKRVRVVVVEGWKNCCLTPLRRIESLDTIQLSTPLSSSDDFPLPRRLKTLKCPAIQDDMYKSILTEAYPQLAIEEVQ